MYKRPTQQMQGLKRPPSHTNQPQSTSQLLSHRPKYIPPISNNKDKKNQTATNYFQLKQRDQQILNIVKQYLSSHGYTKTVQTFRRQKPLSKIGMANIGRRGQFVSMVQKDSQSVKIQQDEKMILRSFQRGQREEFFKSTSKWFCCQEQSAARLQFQLQIYFCVYSVHPTVNKSQSIQKSSLQAFKKYLQTRGNQLASQQQYITYFSLPYNPRPHQNASFAHIFTKEYTHLLGQRLVQFMRQHYEQEIEQSRQTSLGINDKQKYKKCCRLDEIYEKYVQYKTNNNFNSNQHQGKQLGSPKLFRQSKQYQQLQAQTNKLKQKLDQVNHHKEYALSYVQKLSSNIKELAESSRANLLESNKKWFVFARDIIVMVRKEIKRQGFKIQGFDRFEGFFGKNIDEVINNADISIFDKQSMTMDDYSLLGDNRSKNINDQSNLENGRKARQQTSSQLDMIKIQSLFANAQEPGKQMQILLLLKALKNRFSKLKNPYGKRQVIVQYSRHDIIGVTPQKYFIQKKLLLEGNSKIRQLYLRLTYYIAFDLYGINYLTKSDKLIENLIVTLKRQIAEQTASKKFVLAILQRFSYPIKSRKKIVQCGIIPLIFKLFQSQKQSMNLYTLQYLTAMIMNLSLKKECEKHFTPFKQELISTMVDLMCHQSAQIRNYVNGALYLLLNYKQLMEEAKRQHLQERIQELLQEHDEQVSINISAEGSKVKSEQGFKGKSDEEKQNHPHTLQNCLQPKEQQDQHQPQSSINVQYNYILKKLRGQITADEEDSDSDEDSEENVEMDEFEEENNEEDQDGDGDDQGDQSDYIEGQDDYINGQELLLKQFTLLGPEALKEQLLTRSFLDQTAKLINNTTLSMNKFKRLENIFAQKQKGSEKLILQRQFDKLLDNKI